MAAASVSAGGTSNETFNTENETVNPQSSTPEAPPPRPNPWKKLDPPPPPSKPAVVNDSQVKETDVQTKTEKQAPPAKEKIEDKEEKETKNVSVVKKFDNKNYVEAPLPKTNPWNKNSSSNNAPVPVSMATKPGKVFHVLCKAYYMYVTCI